MKGDTLTRAETRSDILSLRKYSYLTGARAVSCLKELHVQNEGFLFHFSHRKHGRSCGTTFISGSIRFIAKKSCTRV